MNVIIRLVGSLSGAYAIITELRGGYGFGLWGINVDLDYFEKGERYYLSLPCFRL